MKDNNCIFCKLANGQIPTNSIYEDDDFKVILDASPASKGHALILPKEHYADIFEIHLALTPHFHILLPAQGDLTYPVSEYPHSP